jgi:hypothetical protein
MGSRGISYKKLHLELKEGTKSSQKELKFQTVTWRALWTHDTESQLSSKQKLNILQIVLEEQRIHYALTLPLAILRPKGKGAGLWSVHHINTTHKKDCATDPC